MSSHQASRSENGADFRFILLLAKGKDCISRELTGPTNRADAQL